MRDAFSPIPILMYHSISPPESASPRFRRWVVSPDNFAAHMEYLTREKSYSPLTVSQLVDSVRAGSLPRRPVVVTFDDGFADFHTHAVPTLVRYALPVTVYICTGFVGDTSRWLWREDEASRPMMTWSQIAELPAAGIECGAHTATHPQLDTLPRRAAEDEIRGSKATLEDHLGATVASFAYPHGYYSPVVRRMVGDAGYQSACGVKHAMSSTGDDPFALARIIVSADVDVPQLAALLRGQNLPVAPFPEPMRTTGWRVVRRTRARLQRQVSA
jgi:peptidoglycan/xylan/chitin deacetylase (PgdA/CDA1 family)